MKPAFRDPEAGREVARYADIELLEVSEPEGPIRIVGRAHVHEGVRDEHGVVHTGIITALADITAGIASGLASLPRWIVSTDLLISRLRTGVVGPIGVEAEVLRAGRSAAVTSVRVFDEGDDDAPLAEGVLTTALLAPEGGPPDHPRPFRITPVGAPPGGFAPLRSFFRLAHDEPAPGAVRLELVDHLRNPWGILHGGATAVLVAETAEHVARRGLDGRWCAGDTVLHYLRPARVGPVIGTGRILGERRDGVVVAVTVRDAGDGDRVVSESVVTVRRP